MNYTPFLMHTDEELVAEVCRRSDPTDLELELSQRLQHHLEHRRDQPEHDG